MPKVSVFKEYRRWAPIRPDACFHGFSQNFPFAGILIFDGVGRESNIGFENVLYILIFSHNQDNNENPILILWFFFYSQGIHLALFSAQMGDW